MRWIPNDKDLGWTPWAWTVYLVPFVLTPLYTSRFANAGGWILFVATTVCFLAIYFRSYWVRERELLLLAGVTIALGVAFWPIAHGAGAFFIYAAGMLGTIDPPRRAFRFVGVIAAIVLVEGWMLDREWFNAAWPLVFTVMVGALNIHFAQVNRANKRLHLAQSEIEHLAKVAERERIARDLHDVVGHTLSLVILKSELAAKLADRDPERAREEIRDVERIAREALAEVRAAVKGYRASGFASEVSHARSTLTTAGMMVEASVPAKLQLPPSHEAVLCLALREAVTNIVRHSGARHCRIALVLNEGTYVMTVADDGRGGELPFGSGLQGMHERVEVLGGKLTRDGRAGTTLSVTLPLPQQAREQERSA